MEDEKKVGDLPEGGTPAEPKVPTNEEMEQLRGDLQKMGQNLKSAQGVSKKQAQDLEEMRGKLDAATSSRDTYQALIGLASQQTGMSGEDVEQEVQAKKPDLMKQAQALIHQQETQRQQMQFAEKVNSYQPIVAELGLKETDPAYKRIRAFAKAGDWQSADEEIEALKSKPQEPAKESEEEKEARIREDERKKTLKEKGLLTPEGGEPSAGGEHTFSKKELIAMSTEEYEKIKPEVDKARREGRIKD